MPLYEWTPADHVMTPKERADAIRQFDWEIAEFNCSSCWESKYDHEPEQLKHRELLKSLIESMRERIAELRKA